MLIEKIKNRISKIGNEKVKDAEIVLVNEQER